MRIYFLLLWTLNLNVFAYSVSKIVVTGNKRTSSDFIINESGLKKGESNTVDFLSAKKNLLSLNIFSHVDITEKNSKIVIRVEEKWTTIPILKVNNGGGVSQITLGVFDPNIFGQYIESGAQYERLGDTNSGVFWFKNPRLFGEKAGITVQLWKNNRLRTKFLQDTKDRVPKTGFLQKREKIYLEWNKFFGENNLKFNYEYDRDKFSTDLVSNEVEEVGEDLLPPNSLYHFLGMEIEKGRVNSSSYLLEGSKINLSFKYGVTKDKSLENFKSLTFNYQFYKKFYKDITFAKRLFLGGTDTKTLQYWWYLGGLDRIRGFSDNRFSGRYYWLSNSELRKPIYVASDYIVQGISFLDLTSVSEKAGDLISIDGASTGVGLRLILPKIYRFILRVDYAHLLKSKDINKFSFGVQQFF